MFLFCEKTNQPTKCPSVGDWLNWCTHTMEYDSAKKKGMIRGMAWMDLKGFTLSEKNTCISKDHLLRDSLFITFLK